MKLLNRSTLMKLHAILAAFTLPAAIMFFVTGAFYTWEIKGSYDKTIQDINLQQPLEDELSELIALATTELQKQNIDMPSGKAKMKRIGDSFRLEWTGSNRDIILEPSAEPLIATLEIKNTSWYRQFVQLHKAKGGTPFKVYAAAFAVALLLLLITGFVMAWQAPKLRKLTLLSVSLGVVFFLVIVATS